jgi:hypothetical protein
LGSIATAGSSGQGTLNILGGAVTAPDVHAGVQGIGGIYIGAGSLSAETISLAEQPGSTGDLNLDGGLCLASSALLGGSNSVVSLDGGSLFVTNAGHTASVILNQAALSHDSGQFMADNLTITNGGNMTISSGATPRVFANLSVVGGGLLNISGASLTVDNGTRPLTSPNGSEADLDWVTVTNGVLNTSNAMYTTSGGGIFGGGGPGTINMSNSVFTPHNLIVGYLFPGTANFLNCSLTCGYGLTLGGAGGITGKMTFSGGTLIATNGYFGPDSILVGLGVYGTGNLVVSNANVQFGATAIANYAGGSLTVQPGSLVSLGKTYLGDLAPGANGVLSIQGGQVLAPELHIGVQGTGAVSVTGGVLSNPVITLGEAPGAFGSLAITGGRATASSNLRVGAGGAGSVVVSSGLLAVTNTNHTAMLVVSNGTMVVSGGTLLVDVLVLTNANGHFQHTGGSLAYSSLVIDPNLSALGDGIPNGWKQRYGFDPFDPNVAGADPDHDGMSNLQEFLAGTDPTNSASNFRIVDFAVFGTNARISWTAVSNHNYEVLMGPMPMPPTNPAICLPCLEIVSPIIHSDTNGVKTQFIAIPFSTFTPQSMGMGSMLDGPGLDACTNNAADDASLTPYSFGRSGWTSSQNGGTGFDPWKLTTLGSGGFFVGDSSRNGNGNSGSINTGNMLTNGSWGMWAAGGATNEALRTFTHCPLAVNNVISLAMDNGNIDPSGMVGFKLLSGGTLRFMFYSTGGNYFIQDGSGQTDTGIPWTPNGIRISFKLTSGDTYLLGGTPNVGPPIPEGVLGSSGSIDGVLLFDYGAGGIDPGAPNVPDQPNAVYFNSLQIQRYAN